MNRRIISWLLTTILLTTASPAEAQPQAKAPKIGWLATDSRQLAESEILHKGLRALGYVEGKNIFIEYRSAEGKLDRVPALADELVRLKVDVIVAISTSAARAAKNATKTIPIVMMASSDAVNQGLVASLARPGGNVTGMTNISPDLAGKQLEILKEAFPRVSRVAVLFCPTSGGTIGDRRRSEMEAASQALKVRLQSLEVGGPDKINGALRAAARGRAEALFVSDCSIFPAVGPYS